MPRIHYDEESINSFINPNLNKAIEKINSAIAMGHMLNISYDLSCKNEINEFVTFFTDKKNRIDNVKNVLEKSHVVANTSHEEVKLQVSALSQGLLDSKNN